MRILIDKVGFEGSVEMAKIVLIDDEPAVREVLQAMLQHLGHEVQVAREGEEGIRLAEQWPADLVITDVLMDGQEGLETLLDLKTRYPRLPVIMISGGGVLGRDVLLNYGHTMGADVTLSKPIKVSELKSATENALEYANVA